MKHEQDYEIDIRNNKVKEGFLIKRSRILKEWKERWMVLTKTHLYSFIQKQVYKKPTESIPLNQVSTIKSYYKNQYSRPQIIRIESDDTEFYLSAKNHQQKLSWMTALQKMTDAVVCGNEQTSESVNLIRQTLRMTTAIRSTVNMKGIDQSDRNDGIMPKDLMRRLKILMDSNVLRLTITPSLIQNTIKKDINNQQQPSASRAANQSLDKIRKQNKEQVNTGDHIVEIIKEKIVQVNEKIVNVPQVKEKIVQVKEKIVYVPQVKEKIVYVPQIKQVIKTVYLDKQTGIQLGQTQINNKQLQQNKTGNSKSEKSNTSVGLKEQEQPSERLLRFFQQVMQLKCQNPKPLIEFVVFLVFAQPQTYTSLILCFATLQSTRPAFSNAFLQVVNEEIDEYKLNGYLQFIMVLYQNYDEYFYLNDLKLLIEILVREMEMNRSNLNQCLILGVLNAMAGKSWWSQVKHRRSEIVGVVSDIKAFTNDPQMRLAAQQLLQKM